MLACRMRCAGFFLLVLLFAGVAALAQQKDKDKPPEKFPSKDEVADLLKREPMTLENWPKWRERLLVWIFDKGQGTDLAFDEARKLARGQADAKDELPEALAKDHLAWYLLASAYLFDAPKDADRLAEAKKSDKAIRKSLELKNDFGFSHRRLAQVLMRLDDLDAAGTKGGSHFEQALKALEEAAKHLPASSLIEVRFQAGEHAYSKGYYALAESMLLQWLRDYPKPPTEFLNKAAAAILINPEKTYQESAKGLQALIEQYPKNGGLECYLAISQVGSLDLAAAEQAFVRARALGTVPDTIISTQQVNALGDYFLRTHPSKIETKVKLQALRLLVEQFPQDGGLVVRYGLAFYLNDEYEATLAEFAKATSLGTDPAKVVINMGLDKSTMTIQQLQVESLIPQIEEGAAEARMKRNYLWGIAGGFAFFLAVMGLMAVIGSYNRHADAPTASLGSLAAAVWLFYAALAYMLLIILSLNIGLVILFFRLPGLFLFVFIAFANILQFMALTLFVRRFDNHPGIVCSSTEAAELRKLVMEAAQSLDAEPISDVRLSPGAELIVYPKAPRLLGLVGSRQRVLSIGFLALRLLTVSELRAILAQRFARLRNNDTAADKYLERHIKAIDESIVGIWAYGGGTNYLNPFFVFLLLYYKCFQRFAGSYRQARVLLADRIAGEQNGGEVTGEAIRKLTVDAPLLEQRLKQLAQELTAQDPDLSNMYAAWDDLCGPQASGEEAKEFAHLALGDQQRTAARQQALDGEQPATSPIRPTLKERLDALAGLPKTQQPRNEAAVELLDNRDAWEEQLTTVALESWTKQKVGAAPAAAVK